jgi:hypothetical protein
MTTKSEAYWAGYNEAVARSAAKAARSAVDAMPDLSALAREVARDLGRDQGAKQRIFARSPGVFSGMDAQELGQASPRELAARELKELGIEVGDCDPVQLLDAHHAGREYARNGNKLMGGSASDSVETASFLDKYINGT